MRRTIGVNPVEDEHLPALLRESFSRSLAVSIYRISCTVGRPSVTDFATRGGECRHEVIANSSRRVRSVGMVQDRLRIVQMRSIGRDETGIRLAGQIRSRIRFSESVAEMSILLADNLRRGRARGLILAVVSAIMLPWLGHGSHSGPVLQHRARVFRTVAAVRVTSVANYSPTSQ